MFSHTLFTLPFSLIAMFLASGGLPEGRVIFWILIALIAGRNGANALNRWVDRKFDARNPRTSTRHLPSGQIKPQEVLWLTAICYVIFVFAAWQISWICFVLSPIALVLFTLYSYTKRFTWACHIVLGITCALAPVATWLAVTGNLNSLIPWIIGIVVVLWIAGFDIIYGTQDIEFDRQQGLFSIPARFGFQNALWIARAFHVIMVLLLIALYYLSPLGYTYLFGVLLSAVLLFIEHYMVDPTHRKKMNVASYHLNQVISVILLTVVTMDVFFI